MANEDQLAILKQGVEAWNKWRWETHEVQIDLREADLRGADLRGARLSGADLGEAHLSEAHLGGAHLNGAVLNRADLGGAHLRGAHLSRADLRGADLNGADLNGADLREAHLSEAHLGGAHLRKADLGDADLRKADLSKAYLSKADLGEAHLGEADLSKAYLPGADLSLADLSGAHLRKADLSTTNLSMANLRKADLRGADLSGANLRGADLREADFSEVMLRDTVFAENDLNTVKGLESVKHEAPSTIGINTIYRSKGNIPQVFLRGCGVPENFITFMHSLTRKAFEFYSCFISHSAKDKPFCERLHNDLQAKGVRTWYFPEDAKWGETVWGEIDRGIKIYDKLIVVCSQNSLQSEPVIREMDRSLQRESREHKNILFPITLDRYIFDTWEHELKADLLRKVIGEFCEWDSADALYRKAFERLLKNLQAESGKT